MRFMKLIITLFLFLTPLFVFSQGNASVKKGTFSLDPFDKIEASKGINVTLEEDKEEKMLVEIENGEVGDVIYSVEGKTLKVKMKTSIGKGVVVRCTIYYKTLISVSSSMGASVDNNGTLYGDILKLSATSDANMTLNVDVKRIDATSSIGKIIVSGVTEFQEVAANTGGKYLANELESKQALLKASTGATIEANVSEKVDSKASSGATIDIIGDPKSVKWEENFGGKVTPH